MTAPLHPAATRRASLGLRNQRRDNQVCLRRSYAGYVVVSGTGRTKGAASPVAAAGDVVKIGFGMAIQVLLRLGQVRFAVRHAHGICDGK